MSYALNANEIIAQNFGEQVVIINLATGVYFSLDGIGAFVWDRVEAGAVPHDIAQTIASQLGIDGHMVRQDLDRLIADLVRHRIVVEAPASAAPAASAFPAIKVYTAPILRVHDEIGHLLALDPPTPGLQFSLHQTPAKKDR